MQIRKALTSALSGAACTVPSTPILHKRREGAISAVAERPPQLRRETSGARHFAPAAATAAAAAATTFTAATALYAVFERLRRAALREPDLDTHEVAAS